jgi:hypothetical protein
LETDSNEWQHRWQNSNGDVVFSTDPGYDPNSDRAVRDAYHADFKRSSARPR